MQQQWQTEDTSLTAALVFYRMHMGLGPDLIRTASSDRLERFSWILNLCSSLPPPLRHAQAHVHTPNVQTRCIGPICISSTIILHGHHSLRLGIDILFRGPFSVQGHSEFYTPLFQSMQHLDIFVQWIGQMGSEFLRAQGQFGEWLSQHTLWVHQSPTLRGPLGAVGY